MENKLIQNNTEKETAPTTSGPEKTVQTENSRPLSKRRRRRLAGW
jgi:hypothetical protein